MALINTFPPLPTDQVQRLNRLLRNDPLSRGRTLGGFNTTAAAAASYADPMRADDPRHPPGVVAAQALPRWSLRVAVDETGGR